MEDYNTNNNENFSHTNKSSKKRYLIYGLIILVLIVAVVYVFLYGFSSFRDKTKEVHTETKGVPFVDNFGDNFSSDVYLNMKETNMYFDDVVTSLTFDPLFDFSKIKVCRTDKQCALDTNLEITATGSRACINSECLQATGNSLYFNGSLVSLPFDLRNRNILSLTVVALDSKWLVGAVTGRGYDEYGYVYSFSGTTFTPIITHNTKDKIEPDYERLGGKIGFGGSDDNYLIVYGGYDGIAYHVQNEKLTDISRFFGLRVTDKGFWPEVFKIKEGKEATWYVCSLSENEPKLLKLWQNNTDEIRGAIDLSAEVFTDDLYGRTSRCFVQDKDRNELVLSSNVLSGFDEIYQNWLFSDKGFDNSHDYIAKSANLNRKEYYLEVTSALVTEIGIALGEGLPHNNGYTSTFTDRAKLQISNDNINWQDLVLRKNISFNQVADELYWKIEFNKEDNNNYSPWFDNVNRMSYGVIKGDRNK